MVSVKRILQNRRLMVIFRLIVGGVFVFSGFAKLMSPPEEFAEAIRSYQIAPQLFLYPLALTLPWVELLTGAFLCVGLFSRIAATVAAAQLALFMGVIFVAMIKGVDLKDCGCFGAIGLKETPPQTLIRDAILLAMSVVFISSGSSAFSLDSRLEDRKEA